MTRPDPTALVRVFGRIGLLSFGGPAAQIALMHQELVERTGWLSEARFLRALSLCMLLPGPEAMQLATYCGWRLRGVTGGLIAGGLFVLPGALCIAILAALYGAYGQLPLVQAGFFGIKAAVIVIVLQALRNIGRKALTGRGAWAVASLSFAAIFALGLPFPLIIAAAALWGYLTTDSPTPDQPAVTDAAPPLWRTVAIWLALWLGPLVALDLAGAGLLSDIGWFFSKLAVVTFGGAYAVLAYMTQTIVTDYGWISTQQMIDALGLAETTPGPLILVTQFVAMLAGLEQGGLALAVAAGLVALWATFTPCFLWIFAAGPYVEALSARPRLAGALSGISAAVVGVILNLSLWFALHVWFADVGRLRMGPATLPWPDPASLDAGAVALTALAAGLVIGLGWGLLRVLAVTALAGIGLGML
ncbi:MAG: chromate efflux transporter [Marinibacterium sp.]|nr:chromate efflux transporter [Marinibacterium sp.]